MNLIEFTATGTVVARAVAAFVATVILTAGSDTATCILRTGGSSGTRMITLSAVTGTSAVWTVPNTVTGVNFSDGVYLTVTGTGVTVDVGWC